MRLHLIRGLFCILAFIPALVPAHCLSEEASSQKRPKIGLVLSGGGALGFAHVGVFKVLEENRIPVDYVTGTSMGSIIGAGVATGKTAEEMKDFTQSIDWDAFFIDNPERPDVPYRLKAGREREILGDAKFGIKDGSFSIPAAAIQGQKVLPTFQRFYGSGLQPASFDELPVPFRAVAADIETGEAVVIDHGDVAAAARASMAVPGIFAPMEINGRLLVDGGIVNNLPVELTRSMGADILIVVDLYQDYKKRSDLKSAFAISGQVLSILLNQNSAYQKSLMHPQDILIAVDTKGYTTADFAKHEELMALGEKTARTVVDKLKQLSLPEAEYLAYRGKLEGKIVKEAPTVEFVRVENTYKELDSVIEETITTKPGKPLNREKLEKDIDSIHKLGYFSQVYYNVVEEDGKTGVVVHAVEKEWARKFFRFGIAFEDDFEGNSNYSLALSYRATALNRWGAYAETTAELGNFPRIYAELYQPLGAGSPYFIAPELNFSRKILSIRDEGDIVAEYKSWTNYGGLKAGRTFGSLGEIAAGARMGRGDLKRKVGDPALGEPSYDIGEYYVSSVGDKLDSPDFPTAGYRWDLAYINSVDGLGADDEFDKLEGSATYPFTWDENTLLFGTSFGSSLSNLPAERSYSLGGFLQVSGYQRDSLIASDFVQGQFAFYRKLYRAGTSFLGLDLFGGTSLEFTSLENDDPLVAENESIFSGSVFVGLDTPIAPAYFAFGLAEEGEIAGYFVLGRLIRGTGQ